MQGTSSPENISTRLQKVAELAKQAAVSHVFGQDCHADADDGAFTQICVTTHRILAIILDDTEIHRNHLQEEVCGKVDLILLMSCTKSSPLRILFTT